MLTAVLRDFDQLVLEEAAHPSAGPRRGGGED